MRREQPVSRETHPFEGFGDPELPLVEWPGFPAAELVCASRFFAGVGLDDDGPPPPVEPPLVCEPPGEEVPARSGLRTPAGVMRRATAGSAATSGLLATGRRQGDDVLGDVRLCFRVSDAGRATRPAGKEALPGDAVNPSMLSSTFLFPVAWAAACGAVDTAA